jgi:chromosome partitioning protein
MRTIAIVNQKGGVGKTTSVVNIGVGLANMNYNVLVVDLDPQANLSYSLGIQADALDITIYDVLKREATIKQAIIDLNGIKVLPASDKLTLAEMNLGMKPGKDKLLKYSFKALQGYDYVLIDCPPNLGLLTLNALTAAEEVFVPLQAEYLSVKGLIKILNMIENVKKESNPSLVLAGILITQYNHRLKLHREFISKLDKYFAGLLFNTRIRRNITIAEASSFGQPIYKYDSKSIGAADYYALCREIKKQGEKHGKKIAA